MHIQRNAGGKLPNHCSTNLGSVYQLPPVSFTIAGAMDLEKTEHLLPALRELRVSISFPWMQNHSDTVTETPSANPTLTFVKIIELYKNYCFVNSSENIEISWGRNTKEGSWVLIHGHKGYYYSQCEDSESHFQGRVEIAALHLP